MVKPDWDAPEFSLPEPGWYHVEVGKAELKQGPKAQYFACRLGEVGTNRGIAFDNIMVTGGGAGMGISKMKCLGIPPGADVEAEDLNGRRAWVYILQEKYTGKDGRQKMKTVVDTRATGTHCGYLSEDEYKEKGGSLAPIDNWKKTDGTEGPAEDSPF
jgi:hypothetical protein